MSQMNTQQQVQPQDHTSDMVAKFSGFSSKRRGLSYFSAVSHEQIQKIWVDSTDLMPLFHRRALCRQARILL